MYLMHCVCTCVCVWGWCFSFLRQINIRARTLCVIFFAHIWTTRVIGGFAPVQRLCPSAAALVHCRVPPPAPIPCVRPWTRHLYLDQSFIPSPRRLDRISHHSRIHVWSAASCLPPLHQHGGGGIPLPGLHIHKFRSRHYERGTFLILHPEEEEVKGAWPRLDPSVLLRVRRRCCGRFFLWLKSRVLSTGRWRLAA